MEKSLKEAMFDFSKPMTKVLEKTSRYNYKKLLFLSISFSVFTSIGISVTSHVYEHFAKEKTQEELQKIHVQEMLKKHFQLFEKQQALLQQKKEKEQEQVLNFEKQQIQAMSPQEFQNFQSYLAKNITIYDTEVEFVQQVIVKAYNEYFQSNNGQKSVTNIDKAQNLGNLLDQHKENLIKNIENIEKTREKIVNNIGKVDNQEIKIFMNYFRLYQLHSIIRSQKIDNNIQLLLFRDNSENGKYLNINTQYNLKNNVYEQFNVLNQKMNNLFVENQSNPQNNPKMR